MKKLLITGASGFIGKNLVEYFSEKYDVLSPTHQALPLEDEHQADQYFLNNDIDFIIHAAVKPYHRAAIDLDNLLDTNVRMYFNLTKQIEKKRAKKMLVTGSGSEYSIENYIPDMTEEYFGQYIPKDEGTFSRYVCAKHIEQTTLAIYNLRIFGIFGKYEAYEIRFISNAICKLLFGLPITLKQDRVFSYLFIDDFLKITERFLNASPTHHAYNITPNEKSSLLELAKLAAQLCEKPDYPIIVKNKGIGTEYSGSNHRLISEFKDIRFTEIKDAVLNLIDYYKTNITAIDKQKLMVDL